MKTIPPYILPLVLAIALPAAAQTASTPKPMHHETSEHHYEARGGCVHLPEMSDKIPALPAGSPCAKALYTITRTPDTKVDYVSPLVGAEVRNSLGAGPETYSLDYIDTKVGTGELVQTGKFVSVKYTGYLADGKKFDSSYDHPGAAPIDFPYGEHRVIPGWDTGFEGMRIGGKRRIFIPYELAYGEAGRPPVIPAKSELIFDVEVVSQSDKQATPPARPEPRPEPHPMPHPAAKPSTSPAGTTAPPPTTSSTPSASTKPTTQPNPEPKK